MNDTQDNKWDKLLHIKTMGRDDSQSDQYRYPYEPTPYSVLQRLANTGLIRKNNMLLDYGCGKGRVDFFLSYQTRCRCLGVEYDERIYEKVMENKKEAVREAKMPGHGGRKPGAVRRRRRTSDATAENGAAELPAMPGNAPGRAEGRPDRAREKDLTQCSLL